MPKIQPKTYHPLYFSFNISITIINNSKYYMTLIHKRLSVNTVAITTLHI